MGSGPLLLSLTLAGAFVLLASLNFRARWPWPIKAATNLAVAGLIVASVTGIRAWLGWPTPEAPAHDFVLLAHVVHEPDTLHGEPGRIYLWLGDPASAGAPRAHALPYRRELHEALAGAAADGVAVVGRLARPAEAAAAEDADGLRLELLPAQPTDKDQTRD